MKEVLILIRSLINNPENAKIYEDTPYILPTIKNKNDFEELVKSGFNSTNESIVDFLFYVPNEKKTDYIVDPINDGTVGKWLYSLGKSGFYGYNYYSSIIDDALLMSLTLESK